LLTTLAREIDGLADRVTVLIGDNACSDATPEVTRAFVAQLPSARVIRHERNLGPDENFCRCVEQADADYFWIMGDDDLPRAGAIRQLLPLLERNTPDLVYLANEWRPELLDNNPGNPVLAIHPVLLDRLTFARRVNVWTTFISGMIVRRATYVDRSSASELREFANTNLVQLGWVFGTLARADLLCHVPDPCVLATSGNTGGYAVLKVFGQNFPAITKKVFGAESPIARAVIGRSVIGYLPGLLWGVRRGKVGDFAPEDAASVLRPQLSSYAAFRLLMLICGAPIPIAKAALLACLVTSRIQRLGDRLFGHAARRVAGT
jgi:glycosyltransferase involved in cell wall biosynthesis